MFETTRAMKLKQDLTMEDNIRDIVQRRQAVLSKRTGR
jgi:hypothetical protein